MADRRKKDKEINKCRECGAEIKDNYKLCSLCNEKTTNEIVVVQKQEYDFFKTVNFYKLKIIDKFRDNDRIVLSFINKYSPIANRAIEETRHMGFVQEMRKIKKIKSDNPPYTELECFKAPLNLIPSVRALKRDRKREDD